MRLSTTRRAWERWLASAGPWKGWSVCPALLAPGIEDIAMRPTRSSPAAQATNAAGAANGAGAADAAGAGATDAARAPVGMAVSLASTLERGGWVVVLDLEPVLGVQVAALLNEWRVANSVLLLPRWPYAQATLPVDGLLRVLVDQAHRLARADERLPNVAFVLDNQRNRPLARRPATDRRADNRYRLAVADLPDLAALRARGMQRILKLAVA